jgi:hypothetical protein
MILLSSIKLERAIAENSLTSWDKAKYIIFVIILYSFSGPIYILTPSFGPKPPIWTSLVSFVSTILVVFITYYGAKKCYLTNKEIDDKDFPGRFAALFIPMTAKFLAITIPIMVVTGVFASSSFFADKETKKDIFIYFMYISAPVATYVFYVFLNRSFKRLKQTINENKKNS